jgi:hypothetical protein
MPDGYKVIICFDLSIPIPEICCVDRALSSYDARLINNQPTVSSKTNAIHPGGQVLARSPSIERKFWQCRPDYIGLAIALRWREIVEVVL